MSQLSLSIRFDLAEPNAQDKLSGGSVIMAQKSETPSKRENYDYDDEVRHLVCNQVYQHKRNIATGLSCNKYTVGHNGGIIIFTPIF